MQSNLVKISNIFNLMVQADSRLEFYHFGWRSDINRNIDNNFDKGTITGRKFPAVQFHVPENTSHSQDGLSYLGNKEEIQITLYFDDLQDYKNDSSGTIDTLIEKWTALKQIAEDFVLNFNVLFCEKYGFGYLNSEIKYIPRSNLHNDKLITWEVSFMLVHTTPCTLEENQINLDSFPEQLKEYDLENYLKDKFCYTELNGLNQYIQIPTTDATNLERTDVVTFSCWVKIPSTVSQNPQIINKRTNDYGYQFGIIFNQFLRFNMNSSGRLLDAYSNDIIISDEWTHVTVTKGTGARKSDINFYINGVNAGMRPIGTDTLTTGSTLNSEPVEIGRLNFLSRYYEGGISNLAIFSRELTASEIFDIYELGFDGPNYSSIANIEGHYAFNEFDTPDLAGTADSTYFNMTEDNIICEE